MYAVPPGNDYILWVSKITSIINVAAIGALSLLSFVEIGVSDDVDIVQGIAEIPRAVYVVLVAILFFSSFVWFMSEWFLQRWNRYKIRHNLGYFYFVMIVTTFALLVVQIAIGRALEDFITMFPLFYLPFAFIYAIWGIVGSPEIRKKIEMRWEEWKNRRLKK